MNLASYASRLSRTSAARTVAIAMIAVTAALGSIVATSATADAASVRCTQAERITYYGHLVFMPSYVSGGNYSRNCYLNTRSSADGATTALQITLNNCYPSTVKKATSNKKLLTLDGIYGANTRRAVIAVQRQIGVTVDGIYGPQTRNKMRWDIEDLGPCAAYGAL